ncbi:MAG TPA: MerR family DNA-binding protein [Acidimicrobiales bacterium]|nr:MerR family DNA-binding protein [Acidimicrobiales bacterium]
MNIYPVRRDHHGRPVSHRRSGAIDRLLDADPALLRGDTPAGYRLYDERTLERLGFIARAKQLGCTLEEIKDLAEAWDSNECAPIKHRLRAVVAAKLEETETRNR